MTTLFRLRFKSASAYPIGHVLMRDTGSSLAKCKVESATLDGKTGITTHVLRVLKMKVRATIAAAPKPSRKKRKP